ncbi:MAG: 1-deoxy-D-xylulose-5-phosphate reductoisomerase [Ruminococcaceae bacterium]|nr:1-deoxy-D-xylulose-5-phosphate reductoisomerase [Oscillospiraceae bacterium]
MQKSISLLGSTGSIGTQTLDVARNLGLRVTALSAHSNVKLLADQCREFKPERVCIGEEKYNEFKLEVNDIDIEILCGDEGLAELASEDESETLVNAVLGMKGLRPTLAAAEKGKKIAFANKETLVAGGKLVTDTVKKGNSVLLPVDSEHSAIFQCIQGKQNKIKKIWLTGSGGPFFGKDYNYLQTVTPEMAIKHPRWNMGKKISVDSASLMNKGLELIEAVHLFDVSPEQVEVVIHPQSIVHSLVEFEDNAILAQLGVPDMRVCIQYALTYPDRMPSNADSLDLFGKNLEFFKYDKAAFPLLEIAQESIRIGGNLPAVMNGANEEAVALFLDHKISFTKMFDLVIDTCESIDTISITQNPTLDDILASDKAAREYVRSHI